jgi:uncharacterized damage-inducible protein DinB
MQATPVPDGFREALLFEFDVAERQLVALANAIPAEKFSWRPDDTARSVSEVLIHVAAGNFFLLSLAGQPAPSDIYGEITARSEQWQSFAKRNDELEKTIKEKDPVLRLLTRSLRSAREAISEQTEAALAGPLTRRTYMRMLAHAHEHMGQMIAYTRVIGLRVPWPDWRPDRRT